MGSESLLAKMLAGELRELLVVSFIVLSNNAVSNRYIERRFRMPVQAWSALLAVKTFPGIRAKEIQLLFPRPQNTISRAVSLLEERGYLVREVSSSDGREKALFVTPAGVKLVDELVDISRRRQEEWLSPLSPAERQSFLELARKIAEGPNLHKSEVMKA